MTIEEKASSIVEQLKLFFQSAGINKAVLGLSGGVDSALVAKLAVMTVGAENVMALIMPNYGVNPDSSAEDAENWAKALGVDYRITPLNPFLQEYEEVGWVPSDLAEMNLQARVRMTLLYHYANSHGAIVLGTGNKTEAMLGYFTKYGDGGVDVLPIADLYKTEVWEMAKHLHLPAEIIEKAPSAELKGGQTDESEIGLTYFEIDEILKKFEKGAVAEAEDEKKIEARVKANAHKLEMPKAIRLTFDN